MSHRSNEMSPRHEGAPAPSRRRFLQGCSAAALTIGLEACSDDSPIAGLSGGESGGEGSGGSRASGTSASSGTIASGGGETSASGAGANLQGVGGNVTPSCDESEDSIEGPFYREGASYVEDGYLPGVADGTLGTGLLRISGRVLSAATCEPIPEATVDVWQADPSGVYDNGGFTLRGKVLTNANGEYEVTTVTPGHYLNGAQYRPAHIHVKVSAAGHTLLTTQLYFPGDPYNDIDPWFSQGLLMQVQPGEGLDLASFEFVLAPA